MKRIVAMLLAVAMLMSMVACGTKKSQESAQEPEQSLELSVEQAREAVPEKTEDLSREDQELIAELIGGEENVEDMSDEELLGVIEQLLQEAAEEESTDIVDLDDTQKKEPAVDNTDNEDAYDEDGAMKKPFDQVYPELIEEEQVEFSGETLLLKLKSDKLTDGLKAAGVGALEQVVPMEGMAWYEAKLVSGTDAKSALAAVRELKEVLLAEYNYEVTTALADGSDVDGNGNGNGNGNNKPKEQWHLKQCGIPNGRGQMKDGGGDPSVVVAVIDTGVDYDHEDLADNIWRNTAEIPDNGKDDDGNGYVDDYYGVDIISKTGNGDDDNGHGTHVAGIIAAKNNKIGVMGIAYNVKIMPIKAAMHNGTLNQADIARAVLYAYENGAEVINMSFGGTACSIAVQDALATAYSRCVLVASAGNSGKPNQPSDYMDALPNYPAALTYVLGVMSVNENFVESAFSNWDTFAFNGVEYELYAPGEAIVSTLPGDRYGALSGTSMAAPMVSAIAALLRSEFADRNTYPTKFIYGQLASTSEDIATCCDPEHHTVNGELHNLPMVVNLRTALEKLPKPDVSVQDFAIFDSVELSDKNNGDGVIDAGETIALGLTLRNRWGMSENTIVTIDTLENGISDPYVQILKDTVNYGSVGTYSTQDCGKIYTGDLFTAWEDPFLIKIADNVPNDYRMTFHVTVTCENALDDKDKTTYESEADLDLNARNGVILPSVIDEDMVLTKDNLYIIPSATIINEGVTVRVEPGTHIQFWGDDANDPYADSYIAYLLVNGRFLVEGTKEEPVYIYPSELMSHYNVEMASTNTGEISLRYADVTNFAYYENGNYNTGYHNRINLAEHCTFRNNYGDYMYYRYLSGGTVQCFNTNNPTIGILTNAKDCVFYKLGLSYGQRLYGDFDRCIFVQCGIDFRPGYQTLKLGSGNTSISNSYKDCVFLDNSFVDQTYPNRYINSTMAMDTTALVPIVNTVSYDPMTGTSYIMIKEAKELEKQFLKEALGVEELAYLVLQTPEEAAMLSQACYEATANYNSYMDVKIRYEEAQGCYVWSDGTPIDPVFDPDGLMQKPHQKLYLKTYRTGPSNNTYEYYCALATSGSYVMFEIPELVKPTDITFMSYEVAIDTLSTYQLAPINTPVQLPADAFLYESTDEKVLTVDENGLVTPVDIGTADVWVYSADRAVKNRVQFTVRDYVALESLSVSAPSDLLAVGKTLALEYTLLPADTTRNQVSFATSDPEVATVDAAGVVTGVGSGNVTITAACEEFTVEVALEVYQQATSLQLEEVVLSGALDKGTLALPQVVTDNGAQTELVWRSVDETVAVVEAGALRLLANGTTSLVVKDLRSGLSAACLVVVSQGGNSPVRQIAYGSSNSEKYVLLEDGSVYVWNAGGFPAPTLLTTGVTVVAADSVYALVAKEDGTIERWGRGTSWNCSATYTQFVGRQIVDLEIYESQNVWVCTADGSAYAMGIGNGQGQLGVGFTGSVNEFTLINLDGVVDIENVSSITWLLTRSGDLYATGYLGYTTTATPVLIDSGVSRILHANSNNTRTYYQTLAGEVKYFYGINPEGNRIKVSGTVPAGMEQVAANVHNSNNTYYIGICDGRVYTGTEVSKMEPVPGITDARVVSVYNGTYYVGTAGGLLLAFGRNPAGYNYMAGASVEDPVVTPVQIPLKPIAQESLTLTSNLQDGVLTGDELLLTFNKQITSVVPKLFADGAQVTVQSRIDDYNYLRISRASGFAEGVTYELVFEAGAINAAGGIRNEEALRLSFTWVPGEQTPDQDIPEETEPVVFETIVDETVERYLTKERVEAMLADWLEQTRYNGRFYGNVILNPISTDFEVTHWLRLQAPSTTGGQYNELPLGGNYWGTTDERAIGLQMIDYADFPSYYHFIYEPYIAGAPENTFPFVTSVTLLNKDGEPVTTVGNEEVTFRVTFNRDMDTTIPLSFRFGSAFPYGDYEVEGSYVDARTWEGVYTLNTLIENGNQFITIENGCSATEDLALMIDQARFGFVIDTSAAQAMIMQGNPTDTGIELTWTQDDFDTLMGYNVYRATKEDGLYTRLNSTVIPAETMEWFDDTVEPGVIYYYNFTVVKTDLTESEPSGKLSIMSKDTMAPDIYHSPVANAFTGANLVISATVTDNLSISYANLYYRITGTDSWKTVRMNKLNDKYSAIVPASDMTVDGLQYYIEAFDGISFTYKGSAETPFNILVQQAVGANELGDVDGDGAITLRDAMVLLYAINDKYNMSAEEFARADLNGDGELWAAEALRILQYVNGIVGSLDLS